MGGRQARRGTVVPEAKPHGPDNLELSPHEGVKGKSWSRVRVAGHPGCWGSQSKR